MSALARALVLLVLLSTVVLAQDSARSIQGMVITGSAAKGALRGVVRDNQRMPIPGAEVYIPELERRTTARDDGSYRFDSLPRAALAVGARHIGHRAQMKKVKIGPDGASLDFELTYAPRALPAIVSSAASGGLSGVVADTGFRVIDSVFVRVSGEGMTTYTNSSGEFFFPLRSGHHLVSLTRPGYAPKVVSVTIPEDSGRRIQAFMLPSRMLETKWVQIEMTQRLAQRSLSTSRVYTREDLERLRIDWVYQAVVMMTAHFNVRVVPSKRCEAIVDGIWRTEVGNLLVDDVDSIELYASGAPCPLVYVWLR
jgi:hypothetical protein